MAISLAPIALDNIAVAIITGFVSFTVAYWTAKATQKNSEATAEKTQAEVEGELRRQLSETDRRVGHLSHLVSEEQHQRRQLAAQLYELEQKDNIKTAYIRSIGHWLGGLCEVLDSKWNEQNPKPRLPNEIRIEIEQTAARSGLTVDKPKKRV